MVGRQPFGQITIATEEYGDEVVAGLGVDPEDFEVCDGKEYFYFHAAAKLQRDTVLNAIRNASGGAVTLF